MNELPDNKPYERTLKAKLRSMIEEVARRKVAKQRAREMLTAFLSQLSERARHQTCRH